tara:strand:+ start:93 stop:500 length:408 start_codon:yes stop_codon:yes gene_type:complete
MKVIKTTALALLTLLMSGTAAAGHHEKGEGPMLAAKPGQIVIVYYWPCANVDKGMSLIKEMIAYERDASPYPYSAAPAIHADGALVSVDVHSSAESMEKAVAWQEADATWQAQFAKMAAACGSADDLSVNVLTMQ